VKQKSIQEDINLSPFVPSSNNEVYLHMVRRDAKGNLPEVVGLNVNLIS